MSDQRGGLPREYFDDLYDRHDDPWGFATRWYERRKRALTLASLPRERYHRILELGCSLGLLTEALAPRADEVLATDISPAAVVRARERVAGLPQVRVQQADIREGLPPGPFDLVVVSEVAYYLSAAGVSALGRAIRAALTTDADVVLCHWRWPVDDYPLSGGAVHGILGDSLGLERLSRTEEADLLLEVFSTDGRSVATRGGLR